MAKKVVKKVTKKISLTDPKTAAKRVAIAKDAYDTLRAGKLYVTTGAYIQIADEFISESNTKFAKRAEGKSLQNFTGELQKTCKVCALGSMFLSHVKLNNDFVVPVVSDKSDVLYTMAIQGIIEDLTKFFSKQQLALIEAAFEGSVCIERSWESSSAKFQSQLKRAREYYNRMPDDIDDNFRLEMILANIIANNGTFAP